MAHPRQPVWGTTRVADVDLAAVEWWIGVMLSRMLGHTSAKVTLDTYADLFDTDLDAVAAALDLKCPFCAHSVPKLRPDAVAGA